jgi:hypothetical protein
MRQLELSEFYNKNFRANIFFCDNELLFKAYSLFMTNSNAYCLWCFGGNIFVLNPDICSNRIAEKIISSPLSAIITHELVHSLVLQKIGIYQYANTPKWLVEGYSEYISKDEIEIGYFKRKFYRSQFYGFVDESIFASEYDDYTLAVSYLLFEKQKPTMSIFLSPPNYEILKKDLVRWDLDINSKLVTIKNQKIKK